MFCRLQKNILQGGQWTMKSKRILSLVLALVMVLGTFGTVFAADELTADIEDVSVAKAVSRLAAFGIVDGMEDGKYHPELDVTRAQFAKLVVEATGLGSAAQATGGTTMFSDVYLGHWATGYINVAAGQGIIVGYLDGSFKPEAQVTYAEAVTMLVRALGYQDEFLPGSWPGNYVAKAADTGITKGVSFSPSGFADRGTAAVMLNNALDADVVKVITYEVGSINYQVTDTILMTEKLDIDKVENIRLISTSRLDTALSSDEIRILVLKDDTMIDGKYYDRDDEVDVEVVDAVNVEALIGLEIVGYFEDDLMLYTETVTSETSSIRGIAYDDEGDGTVLSLETFKYYDWASDAKLFVNNEDRSSDLDITSRNKSFTLNDILADYDANYSYAYGNLVLEKGRITFADLSVFEIVSGVVQDVSGDVIQYIDTWEAVEEEDLNLGDYDEFNVLALDGSKMDLEDVQEGDRIYFYEDAQDDELAYVLVDQSDIVKGELTEYRSGNASGSGTRGRVYIDGESYSLADDWTYSLDSMDSFVAINRFDNLNNAIDDVLDETATLYLDTKGRVSLLVSDVDETSDNYGVAVRAGSTVRDEIKLWVPEADDTITYEIDEFENGTSLAEIDDNDIVKYDINKDGTIDILGIVYKADGNQNNAIVDGDDEVIFRDVKTITTTSVQLDNNNYYFDISKSSYIDYSDYKARGFTDDEDLEALIWKDFEDTVVMPGTKVVLVTDGDSNDIGFMAFIDGYDNIASDDLYVGYLLKTRENADVMTITVKERSGEVEYKITKTADKALFRQNVERPIVYTLSGEGIKLKDPATTVGDGVELVKGLVTSRSGNDLYVDGIRYVMENNVVIWEADDEIGKFDLVKDYPVLMLVQDGKVAVIAWDYGYEAPGTGTGTETGTETGTVTYINVAENLIEVDDEVLALDTKVKLIDAEGATLAIGKDAVVAELAGLDAEGEVVLAEITVDEFGDVVEMKLAATEEEPGDEEPGDEEPTVTASAEVVGSALGVDSYAITVEGAELTDVDDVLVNGASKTFEIKDGVLRVNSDVAVETIEIVIGADTIEASL